MTIETIQEMEAAHLDLVSEVKELRKLLLGDEELRAKWEAGKPNYPNITEPPPGAIASMSGTMDNLSARIRAVASQSDRLEAFFGPMLRDKHPPLDGAEIATRGYVDESMVRFSRAFREEITNAQHGARELAANLMRQLGGWNGKADAVVIAVATAVNRLNWTYTREVQRDAIERERNSRPSRLQLLVQLVTGRTPKAQERAA